MILHSHRSSLIAFSVCALTSLLATGPAAAEGSLTIVEQRAVEAKGGRSIQAAFGRLTVPEVRSCPFEWLAIEAAAPTRRIESPRPSGADEPRRPTPSSSREAP